jgi:GNAT superfamily N-acetyltransferase
MTDRGRLQVFSTAERPELAPIVAAWLWEEFRRRRGQSLEATLAAVEASTAAQWMPRTFVLLDEGRPVGTASLAEHDLDERPDLSPWLAGVYVVPPERGRGLAAALIAAVEDEAARLGVPRLWLYTRRAERVYRRAGWETVETVVHGGKAYALMRRELQAPVPRWTTAQP